MHCSRELFSQSLRTGLWRNTTLVGCVLRCSHQESMVLMLNDAVYLHDMGSDSSGSTRNGLSAPTPQTCCSEIPSCATSCVSPTVPPTSLPPASFRFRRNTTYRRDKRQSRQILIPITGLTTSSDERQVQSCSFTLSPAPSCLPGFSSPQTPRPQEQIASEQTAVDALRKSVFPVEAC